jgi:peptidoglycan lytic transglycosylase G
MRRLLLFALVLLLLVAAYGYTALYRPFQGFARDGVFVDIPHGASQRTIGRLLAGNGVVRNSAVFEALCRWKGRHTLEAGEYFFEHPATAFDVYSALANGRVYVKQFVVPEGLTMFDIAEQAAREGFVSRQEFLAAARDPSLIRDIAPGAPSLEGFLFPATYEFPRHMKGTEMTAAMVKRFRQVWLALPSVITPAGRRNAQEVVTLASLVERETPRAEERPHIAGVFENRLRLHMPLQCDPTVAYALTAAGMYSGKLDGGDLHFDSPYNTYQNRGLPPGPIANPGEASLRAALDPSTTDDLYFVANTAGGHFFSPTLKEHNQNVAHYRQLLEESQSQGGNDGQPVTTLSKSSSTRPR